MWFRFIRIIRIIRFVTYSGYAFRRETMQTVDLEVLGQDLRSLQRLRIQALEGTSRVLAEKFSKFMDTEPGVKPTSVEVLEMLLAALDDAVLVGRGEYAALSGDSRAALMFVVSASNLATRDFDEVASALVERLAAVDGRPIVDDRLLSTEEVARILNVSRPYVAKLADAGNLGVVEHTEGKHRRILASAVEAYRRSRQAKSRQALRKLTELSQSAGLYDTTRITDEGTGGAVNEPR
jgi:excisionase family DNA binding protein